MLHIEEASHPNTKQKTESSTEFLETAFYNILYFHGKKNVVSVTILSPRLTLYTV